MARSIIFLICSLSLLVLSACAGTGKEYSCTWTPDLTGPRDATFCVFHGANNGKCGSPMPVLEDPETKKVKQISGQDLFLDASMVSAVKDRATSGNGRKCKYFWVSAKAEVKPETGEYWAPQWGSEERISAKRTYPYYKVLIHELNSARCIKK